MDKAGRKLLMVIGQIGMFIFFLLLSLSFVINARFPDAAPKFFGYLSVVGVVGFVISFAYSMGPIPWLMVGEIFPSSCRAYAVSIAVTVNWLCNFIVALTFPQMNTVLKQYTFFPFTGIILLGIIFTIVVVPETKGKTIEEIVGFSAESHSSIEEETTY
jgi:MFS family permease